MFKLIIKFFCTAIISLSLSSCSTMKSEHYVGEKIPVQEDFAEESIWQFEDTVFYVRTLGSGESATITASSLLWNKSEKKYKVKTAQVIITKLETGDTDESYFLNLKDEKEGLYTILHLVPSTNERDMVFFTIDTGTMRDHITEGKIKAVEQKDAFILKCSKEELDNYIRENLTEIFDFGGAGILKSLKGFKKMNSNKND